MKDTKEKQKTKRSSKRLTGRFSIPDTPENVARAMFGIKRKPEKGENKTQGVK
jgi:hypothetical protein